MRFIPMLAAAVLVGGPATAQQPQGVPHPRQGAEPPPAAFQIIRSGDNSMECPALIAEITALSERTQQLQTAMTESAMAMSRSAMAAVQRPGLSGGGAAMSLGGMAASLIPGAAYVMGAASVASAAAQRAQMAQQHQQQMADNEALTAGMAELGPMNQRMAHLAEISRTRGC